MRWQIWPEKGIGIRICVACNAVLCFLFLSMRDYRQEFVFHRVGNGVEPQAGPGLVGRVKGLCLRLSHRLDRKSVV